MPNAVSSARGQFHLNCKYVVGLHVSETCAHFYIWQVENAFHCTRTKQKAHLNPVANLQYQTLALWSYNTLSHQQTLQSLRQRLHLLLELLYGDCDERMRQEIKCLMLLSLRVQICLLSSVEFLCLAWRNDAVWFLYLVLKSFSVSAIYVSVVLLSLRVTVAW